MAPRFVGYTHIAIVYNNTHVVQITVYKHKLYPLVLDHHPPLFNPLRASSFLSTYSFIFLLMAVHQVPQLTRISAYGTLDLLPSSDINMQDHILVLACYINVADLTLVPIQRCTNCT